METTQEPSDDIEPEIEPEIIMQQPITEIPQEEMQLEDIEVSPEDISEEQILEGSNEPLEKTDVKNLISQGNSLFNEGKYSDAILAWQQVLELEPGKHPDIEKAIKDAMGKVK